MANPEHVEILKQGVGTWNAWRRKHGDVRPDLIRANLSDADLRGANLNDVELSDANLRHVDLSNAYLKGAFLKDVYLNDANLSDAHLSNANISNSDLINVDLSGAYLGNANLDRVDLRGAKLARADLIGAYFRDAFLNGADFTDVKLLSVTFANVDLRNVIGLEAVNHHGPSTIGIDTIYKSRGEIPKVFLRCCGLPESFIVQIPALIGALEPIQFHSCFISYSHKDEDFARRLSSRLRDAGLRVWYAPEEMKGGGKLHEQIFSAIQVHDKLLLVLSENSLRSEWVMTEIRRARKDEREGGQRKLFPIRLVDFEAIQKWECFDVDSGKDLAVEVREFFIPDFSNWKDHDSFERAFAMLLRDLKAGEARP